MTTLKVTPKDFFLWVGAMFALYGSIVAFITLLFSYIDRAFPDALAMDYSYAVDPYSSSIRFAMASLIVLVPVSIILLQLIRKDIAKESGKKDLWIRRWALFLTIFIAGASMAIDLITLINYFLGGELTTRFVLKVVSVLLVASAVFMHFLADLWGYWIEFPSRARTVGIAAAVLVLATIISGFFIIGSPASARLARFDAQKVSDLQTIQWQIINYYQAKGAIPVKLSDAADPLSGTIIPKDPQTLEMYEYSIVKAPYTFEICASFNTESGSVASEAVPMKPVGGLEENWQHGIGRTCFERTIDPQRYPLLERAK